MPLAYSKSGMTFAITRSQPPIATEYSLPGFRGPPLFRLGLPSSLRRAAGRFARPRESIRPDGAHRDEFQHLDRRRSHVGRSERHDRVHDVAQRDRRRSAPAGPRESDPGAGFGPPDQRERASGGLSNPELKRNVRDVAM